MLLAYLVPGAGHVYLGRVRRGIIIFVMISATFWAGIAMGGVMTLDNRNERWWFLAAMLTGVHGLVSWQRQTSVYNSIDQEVRQDPDYLRMTSRSNGANRRLFAGFVDAKLAEKKLALVAPSDTAARAYTGVAGLLNFMCIFDALMLGLMGTTGEPPIPKKLIKPSGKKQIP